LRIKNALTITKEITAVRKARQKVPVKTYRKNIKISLA